MRVLLAIGIAALGLAVSAAEDDEPQKIRVAYCEDRGFNEIDGDGNRVGVAPEFLSRIASRGNYTLKWVDTDFGDVLERLEKGEVDVACGVANFPERHVGMLFTHTPIGFRRASVFVLRSSPLANQDLTALGGCTVGVITNCLYANLALEELDMRGISYDKVCYRTPTELERALLVGDVQAAISDASRLLMDATVLFSSKSIPVYLVTAPERHDLEESFDEILNDIVDLEPNLVRDLRRRFFPYGKMGSIVFSAAERDFISQCQRSGRSFRFDFSPCDGLFGGYNAKKHVFSGFLGALVDEIHRLSGLEIEPLEPVDDFRLAVDRFDRGESDIWIPGPGANDFVKANGYDPSRVLGISPPQVCCVRRYSGKDFSDPKSRIAVWRQDQQRILAFDHMGLSSRLVVCNTREQTMQAVLDGNADCVVWSYQVARAMEQKLGAANKLDITVLEALGYDIMIPVLVSKTANPALYSILSKVLRQLTRDTLIDLEHRAESVEYSRPLLTFTQLIFIVMAVFLVGATVTILFLSFSRRRIRRALHAQQAALMFADSTVKENAKTNKKLEVALRRAEDAARTKSAFLATMSHEIRTPLNAVIGFSEFLQKPGITEEQITEYAGGISSSATSLLSLINDILDISKFESGRTEGLDMRQGTVSVPKLFKEMYDVFRMRAVNRRNRLHFAIVPDFPVLELTEARLRQIALNLIGNAIKFTESGKINISADYQDGVFTLCVQDTGIGISEDAQKKVFDPFVQDLATRSGKIYSGTGLGLSIVKRLVDSSGGNVVLESTPGIGSKFTVTIPGVREVEGAAVDAATDAALEAANGEELAPRPVISHVVIVDDVAINCKILSMYCKSLGVSEIKVYSSGKEVLEYLVGGGAADLLLSDLWMPVMDGSELARRVKEIRPGLPVVAVTADTDAGGTFDVKAFADIITKPVTSDKLRALIEKFGDIG